jgi:hypothetical protein
MKKHLTGPPADEYFDIRIGVTQLIFLRLSRSHALRGNAARTLRVPVAECKTEFYASYKSRGIFAKMRSAFENEAIGIF